MMLGKNRTNTRWQKSTFLAVFPKFLRTREFALGETGATGFAIIEPTLPIRFIVFQKSENLYTFEFESGEVTLSNPHIFSDSRNNW